MFKPRHAPRFPRSGSTTRVIGHRGDPSRFPQNSIAGILAAGDAASMAEIDVRPSRDGMLVLSHDPHITEDRINLVDHDWANLSAIDLGDGHHLELFTDLMEVVDDFPLNIEIKNLPGHPDFEPDHGFALVAASYGREIDLITCFHWPTMHAVAAAGTAAETGLLISATDSIAKACEEARSHGHTTVVMHASLIADDPESVVATTAELAVGVYTVNDPDVGIRLADANVAGVITDDPAAMVAALQGARR